MQKKVAVRRVGVVAGLTAGLIGIGGVTASAFAAPADSDAIIGTAPCAPGWTGIQIIVDGIPIVVCTNI